MRRSATQAGFTLTEMMVVVAIIAILCSMAYLLLSSALTPADVAAQTSPLFKEAGRRAVTNGAVRGDVVLANPSLINGTGQFPRTRIHVRNTTPRLITVERLQEDPAPLTTASWYTVQQMTLPPQVVIKGWRPTADLNGGVGPSVNLNPTDEVTVQCYPNALCDAATLYFDNAKGYSAKARVVMMPLGGSPVVYESW